MSIGFNRIFTPVVVKGLDEVGFIIVTLQTS